MYFFKLIIYLKPVRHKNRNSAVGIATRYDLNDTGIECRTCPDRSWGPPCLLYNQLPVIFLGKATGGVVLITHPIYIQG
jgi:hypothetical protein